MTSVDAVHGLPIVSRLALRKHHALRIQSCRRLFHDTRAATSPSERGVSVDDRGKIADEMDDVSDGPGVEDARTAAREANDGQAVIGLCTNCAGFETAIGLPMRHTRSEPICPATSPAQGA
jgi:hypothetical protein